MVNRLDWSDFSAKIADYTGMEIGALKMETNIYSDLGMDSLGLFSLGMYLIKTFGIKIPLASVAAIETIGDIFALMKSESEK